MTTRTGVPSLVALLAGLLYGSVVWAASEPELKWAYAAQSNLYAPPLVADVCPAPGLETIFSDSEARRLRCVDSVGKPLWECSAGWTKRLTTSAALSMTARVGKGTLIIGAI